MKRVWLVLLAWLLAGVGAVVGSILGNGGGQRWLFVGAILGGALATISAAWLASRLRLIGPQQVRGAAVGGLLGFAVAAPLAASNLHTPVIPVLSTGLPGLGTLLGALHFAGPRTYQLPTEAIMDRHVRVRPSQLTPGVRWADVVGRKQE